MTESRTIRKLAPGTRVRVEQRILQRRENWQTTIEGEVLSHDLESTGSWYAHGKKDLLWLSRLRIRKADGEISAINLDGNSRVTILK